MCRILFVRSAEPFSIAQQLAPFAELSKNSREFQGHGWGCSWLADASETSENKESGNYHWKHYRCIDPVWEDDINQFGSTKLLLVHARSAFRDEGIAIENNMPFSDGDSTFIFNGELRGVKIKSEGRIGAEKIYNYIRRMDKGDKLAAMQKAIAVINKRTSYVRAMNIILSDGETSVVASGYGEDPGYFQMHRTERDGLELVCSQPFPGESDWQLIENGSIEII